ncbi:FecR family protein [Mucilaginibacter terrenus]|uniref:FecR family protein n=1 Tax=Mucilaginibacter terrenus TaxID=2482727 RepID=A0A3E2NJI6_9SPHI|nr:FecR family protein [Mucilaginibacter terrenus]RFZ81145.1 FecR family protein [Mucilaginibacter terrenus]
MKKPLPVELLEKYLRGDCSEEEKALVKQWYASFDNESGYLDTLAATELQNLEDKIYSRILANIEVTDADNVVNLPARRPGKWYKVAGAAAVLLMISTAALFYFRTNNNIPSTLDTAAVETIAVTNNSDHIYRSVLPDSSTVWLNPHATLHYPKVFGNKARMVSMTGECFFEVTKNPARPFIITGNTIVTKVWGTSFLIRDNGTGEKANVSVVTGKVSVSIKDRNTGNLLSLNKGEVILYPQQKATYLANTHVLSQEKMVDNSTLKIWQHVSLNFDNKPLKDIVRVLNTTFDVSIRVTDTEINKYKLNADLSGLNLPEILEALSKSMNIDYAVKNSTIELSKPIN